MAASSFIITIARVAEMLGEDEDLLFEIACDMTLEDGCIDVFGNRHLNAALWPAAPA